MARAEAPPARRWPARLRAALPDLVLFAFAATQLVPFLAAFHQTADDNFWQYAVLSTEGSQAALGQQVERIAHQQGRVGMYLAMPLVLLGAMLPEFAWGRLLAVALFAGLLLAFCHLLARRFRIPLTRAALLLTLCLTPVAAHHMPPNAYPLLITLPLVALVALHIRLAGGREALSARATAGAALGLAALTLVLEYALVAGLGLGALAVMTAGAGRRLRALRLHGVALLASVAVYLAYRAAFPSDYAGNLLAAPSPGDVLHLQALHAVNGTVIPYLGIPTGGRTDFVLAAAVLVAGAWLAHRLLPALARALPRGVVPGVLLACLAWAWLNTLPHALTSKYQAWCRAGECAYVDSRVAALGLGAFLAVGLAALLRLAAGRSGTRADGAAAMGTGGRLAALACALSVGAVGALTFLHNRAAARDMAGRERPFAVLREAACRPEADLGRNPVVLEMLARTVWWHLPPAKAPPAQVYLAAYRDSLAALGLACRPVPFAPPTRSVEFLGWSGAEEAGRWSVGPGGLLLLAGQGGSDGMVLTLAAYVPPGERPRRIVARGGDGKPCRFELGAAPLDLFVPWEAGSGRGKAILVLETPDAVSPLSAGESEDGRALGVLLSASRPLPAGEAPPGGIDLRACAGRPG